MIVKKLGKQIGKIDEQSLKLVSEDPELIRVYSYLKAEGLRVMVGSAKNFVFTDGWTTVPVNQDHLTDLASALQELGYEINMKRSNN